MELTQKGEMVSRLQVKAGQIGKILSNLEKYNHLIKDVDKKLTDRKFTEKRTSILRDLYPKKDKNIESSKIEGGEASEKDFSEKNDETEGSCMSRESTSEQIAKDIAEAANDIDTVSTS